MSWEAKHEIEGSIVVHNHPYDNVDSSLSHPDIMSFIEYEQKETSMVTIFVKEIVLFVALLSMKENIL